MKLPMLSDALAQKVVGTFFRHLLTFGGGWLVERGLVSQASLGELVPGLVVALTGIVWSIYQKKHSEDTIQKALVAPVGTTREDLKALPVPAVPK